MSRKLNVLQFICPAGFYGAERWILALARNLDREQVACQLAVTHESPTQNIEIHHRFRELELPAYKIPMRGRFDPRGLKRLAALIKKQRIDIIHTHGYKSDILGWLAARMAGIPCVATPHGFENARDLKLQLFIRFGSWVLRYFDRVAPLSDGLKQDLIRLKVHPDKIRLIQNGVDLSEIDVIKNGHPEPAARNGRLRKIVYVGQLSHRKNLTHLIDVFARLYREMPNLRLILIGEGPQRQELQACAKEHGCSDAVAFLGYREDRLELVRSCDLFCMTSSLEGIPRAMMEAMALDVPVAAYDIPGVDRLIQDKRTGLLAPFGDVQALTACWRQLLDNDALAERVAQSGRQHVEQHFSAQRMAADYVRLYREIIPEPVDISGHQSQSAPAALEHATGNAENKA